jgi:hypothetical protein
VNLCLRDGTHWRGDFEVSAVSKAIWSNWALPAPTIRRFLRFQGSKELSDAEDAEAIDAARVSGSMIDDLTKLA